MTQKKKWSAQAKLKIALLAIKGDTTINELCRQYQVAPSQVHAWKKQLLEEGEQLFAKTTKLKSTKQKSTAAKERETAKLYEKMGTNFARDKTVQ